MADTTTKLDVNSRAAAARARPGACAAPAACPGCCTAASGEAVGFDADARELRLALAGSGAVLDLSVDGGNRRRWC